MDTKTIKEKAKELIDNLSTNEANLSLTCLNASMKKKNKKLPGGRQHPEDNETNKYVLQAGYNIFSKTLVREDVKKV